MDRTRVPLTILLLLILMSLVTGCYQTENTVTTVYTRNLHSLILDSSVRGEFFLGTGTYEEKESFVFYEITSDGGFTLITIDARSAIIYEDALEGTAWVDYKESTFYRNEPPYTDKWWEIHVPKGSTISLIDPSLPQK
jgi:hypothetical protein